MEFYMISIFSLISSLRLLLTLRRSQAQRVHNKKQDAHNETILLVHKEALQVQISTREIQQQLLDTTNRQATHNASSTYRDVLNNLMNEFDHVSTYLTNEASLSYDNLGRCFWPLPSNQQAAYNVIGYPERLEDIFGRSARRVKDTLISRHAIMPQDAFTKSYNNIISQGKNDVENIFLKYDDGYFTEATIKELKALATHCPESERPELFKAAYVVMGKLSKRFHSKQGVITKSITLANEALKQAANESIPVDGEVLTKIRNYGNAFELWNSFGVYFCEEFEKQTPARGQNLSMMYHYALVMLLMQDSDGRDYVVEGKGKEAPYYQRQVSVYINETGTYEGKLLT